MKWYSYGGTVLPKLPDEFAEYLYGFISANNDRSSFRAYFSNSPADQFQDYNIAQGNRVCVGFPDASIYGTNYPTLAGKYKYTWGDENPIIYPGNTIWDNAYAGQVVIGVENQSYSNDEETIIWTNHDIYDTNGVLQISKMDDPVLVCDELMEFVSGYILGTSETPQVAFRSSWPIEWSYPEMMDNYKVEQESVCAVLVSGYAVSEDEYEHLVLEVTENGVVSTYRFKEVYFGGIAMGENSEYLLSSCEKASGSFEVLGTYFIHKTSDTTPRQYRLRLVKED